MNNRNVVDAAGYTVAAADIYAAFRATPASTSVADDWNAMKAVQQAVRGRSGVRIVDLGGIDRSRDQLALARAAAGAATPLRICSVASMWP